MTREEAIKWFKESLFYNSEHEPVNMAIEALRVEPCEDTISRKAAIDAFNTDINELVVAGKENADSVERYLNRVINEIKQLPTIQPKRGRWINCDGGIATCSICGDRWGVYGVMNFCPSCGAKMEGVHDE